MIDQGLMSIQVGDTVAVTDPYHPYATWVGEVTDLDDVLNLVQVEFVWRKVYEWIPPYSLSVNQTAGPVNATLPQSYIDTLKGAVPPPISYNQTPKGTVPPTIPSGVDPGATKRTGYAFYGSSEPTGMISGEPECKCQPIGNGHFPDCPWWVWKQGGKN